MIKTINALRRRVNQERFDVDRLKLIVEDAESMDTFTVRAVELAENENTAVIVVERVKE